MRKMGTRVLTLEEGKFLMDANRKTTRRRVRREIMRMGTRVLTLVDGRFLMEANRKTTRRRVRSEFRRVSTRARSPC
jgi:hypothetical protein